MATKLTPEEQRALDQFRANRQAFNLERSQSAMDQSLINSIDQDAKSRAAKGFASGEITTPQEREIERQAIDFSKANRDQSAFRTAALKGHLDPIDQLQVQSHGQADPFTDMLIKRGGVAAAFGGGPQPSPATPQSPNALNQALSSGAQAAGQVFSAAGDAVGNVAQTTGNVLGGALKGFFQGVAMPFDMQQQQMRNLESRRQLNQAMVGFRQSQQEEQQFMLQQKRRVMAAQRAAPKTLRRMQSQHFKDMEKKFRSENNLKPNEMTPAQFEELIDTYNRSVPTGQEFTESEMDAMRFDERVMAQIGLMGVVDREAIVAAQKTGLEEYQKDIVATRNNFKAAQAQHMTGIIKLMAESTGIPENQLLAGIQGEVGQAGQPNTAAFNQFAASLAKEGGKQQATPEPAAKPESLRDQQAKRLGVIAQGVDPNSPTLLDDVAKKITPEDAALGITPQQVADQVNKAPLEGNILFKNLQAETKETAISLGYNPKTLTAEQAKKARQAVAVAKRSATELKAGDPFAPGRALKGVATFAAEQAGLTVMDEHGNINIVAMLDADAKDMEKYLKILRTMVQHTPELQALGRPVLKVLQDEWDEIQAERTTIANVRKQLPPLSLLGSAISKLEDGDRERIAIDSSTPGYSFMLTRTPSGGIRLMGTTPKGKEVAFDRIKTSSGFEWAYRSEGP